MEIGSLVALAGNTLVTAAVTDAWEATRHSIARLFGRGHPNAAIERRLDATHRQLAMAEPGEIDQVRADLAVAWATRLADLLDDHPEAEAELRILVDEIQARLGASSISAADHSVAADRDVIISADRGGVAAAVIHGNVGPPGPTLPDPASGQPGPGFQGQSGQNL